MKRYALLLAPMILGGCVSSAKFKTQEAEAHSQRRRAESVEGDLQSAHKDLEGAKASLAQAVETAQKTEQDLKGQLETSREQIASLQKSSKDLQESLEAKKGELTNKIADLVKEKDGLAQRLAETGQKLSDVTRELEEARVGHREELLRAAKEREEEAEGFRAQLRSAETKIADREARLAAAEAARALEAAKRAEEVSSKAAEIAQVKKGYEDLSAGLKAEIAAGEVKLTELKGKLTVNLVDRILFDSGEAAVKPEGRKILQKVGGVLGSVSDKDIRIEGHTDNKPIGEELRERYASNWELSTARATSVARYLLDHARVEARRLVAAGYGEARPLASNETVEGRSLNRRIEIVLVPRE